MSKITNEQVDHVFDVWYQREDHNTEYLIGVGYGEDVDVIEYKYDVSDDFLEKLSDDRYEFVRAMICAGIDDEHIANVLDLWYEDYCETKEAQTIAQDYWYRYEQC